MKKTYIPLLALALTACQEGNITLDIAATGEMTFKVLAPGAVTKVTGNSFDAMDQIGLYVTDYVDDTTPMPLQISGNRANNITVTFDGSAWTPEKAIYWGAGKSDVYAYYPCFDEVQDVESQFFAVATDQTAEGYEASDLLWAKAEGVKQTDGAVNLQMNHLMSKLTVKIVAGEDYVGSLPDDASVLLHSTVTGARVDLSKGSVSKDAYSSVKSIKMKKLGLRTYEGVQAVVYEAIVVPQMLESSVPFLEINSKSVSYLLEDPFNFRPGVAYTYTATLNTSTTSIKVDIGCELEDWNSTGGESGGEGEGGGDDSGEGEEDEAIYTDLSASGTANCYLVQGAGNYKFKTVIGNTDATVGNVKSVEVLWESFGTDEMPNVGDLIASADYKDGYIRFSTPENFRDGNAVIAAKNVNGTILWSWHIWCAEEGWTEQVYANNAGTMMDRNLGAISATPGDVGALGLLYQWGRKDPFLAALSIFSSSIAISTGFWSNSNDHIDSHTYCEANPMTLFGSIRLPRESWQSVKTACDPCPVGWRVPDGGEDAIWKKAGFSDNMYDGSNCGILFGDGVSTPSAWYPGTGWRSSGSSHILSTNDGLYWSALSRFVDSEMYSEASYFEFNSSSGKVVFDWRWTSNALSVRCQKE